MDAASGEHVKQLALTDPINRLHFSSGNHQLMTDHGTLCFSPSKSAGPDAYAMAPLYIKSDWVTSAGRNLLWLPHDRRRAQQFSFYDNIFASSGHDGTIALVEFDPEKIVLANISPPQTTKSQMLPQPQDERGAKADKWYRSLARMRVRWAAPRRNQHDNSWTLDDDDEEPYRHPLQQALEASAATRRARDYGGCFYDNNADPNPESPFTISMDRRPHRSLPSTRRRPTSMPYTATHSPPPHSTPPRLHAAPRCVQQRSSALWAWSRLQFSKPHLRNGRFSD
jgi:hypothetical protein